MIQTRSVSARPEQDLVVSHVQATTRRESPEDWSPSGVLSHEATKGRFSLQNVLNADECDEQTSVLASSKNTSDDPIVLGLLNLPLAKSLFQSFMLVLNPYISQLDPELHTFTYVRHKSAFLLSSILTAASKVFHPIVYAQLYEHSQDLSMLAFRRGNKNVEIVQAMLILTYWKESKDDRVFTSVGYAIRMCIDLGWHKFEGYGSGTRDSRTEVEQREERNVGRTWLVLFVYDRSISLQTGKPYMIECNDFIESVETWVSHALAIDNDRLLGALVRLRLLTSTTLSLVSSYRQRTRVALSSDLTPLVVILLRRIDTWEQNWTTQSSVGTNNDAESCHEFLIRFYGSHLRLQLSSMQLQPALSEGISKAPGLDNLWRAYSSALSMLRMIPRYPDHLSFAQDSVHVMLAYCAAFLVKLLLRAPQSVAEQLEPEFLTALHSAASVFSRLAGPSSPSCTLQADFLRKIISKLNTSSGPDMATTMIGRQDQQYLSTSQVNQNEQGPSFPPSSDLDLPAYDTESWDGIFASVGLDMDMDLFLS